MARTGKRIVIHRAGSYDQMKVESFEVPDPAGVEVLVDVRAIGVNYADCIVRMGLYSSAKEYVGWPITPGFEVSGTVAAVGPDVDDLQPGDEVVAITLFDGYASHVTVERPYVFRKPSNMSFEQAGSLPAVMLTAWYALFELAHPRPGANVLVHSAAGGVGTSLVQLSKNAGCNVVGVVGASHKVETAAHYGCDHVIDKSTQDMWGAAQRRVPDGYDVIFDANGVATLGDSYEHLRRTGKLVVYGFHTMMPKTGGRPNWLKLAADWLRTPRFNPLDLTTDSKSVLAFNLSYLYDRTDLLGDFVRDFEAWTSSGAVEPLPVETYPLEEVGRAHADIESAQTVGKLVLIP